MTIAILATGDEIVQGDTLNTNAHQIAQALAFEGLSLGYHMVCADDEEAIVDCILFLQKKHNIIIMTGGLGPTSDDKTRFALAKALNSTLIVFDDALNHVEARLKRAALKMTPGNHQQCLFPEGATLYPNPHGTAFGCCISKGSLTLILLPGPPRECLPMFNDYVLPLLQKTVHHHIELLKWRLFGVAEGAIAHILDDSLKDIDCTTGYRLDTPYVEFKVYCKKALTKTVKKIIDPLVSRYIIAPANLKASTQLKNTILERQLAITIIDKITGGRLETLLSTPDTYALLNFHEKKSTLYHFHLTGLNEYWNKKSNQLQESPTTTVTMQDNRDIKGITTELTIHYNINGKYGQETKQLPYRSPLVIDMAVEWLCFRMFHLINESH